MDAARLFHLTGRRTDATLLPIDGRGLRPALFAPFRDLTRLRYDFPLVLVDGDPPVALSALFDAAADASGSTPSVREHARRLLRAVEREIRAAASEGVAATLDTFWDLAVAQLAAREGEHVRIELAPLRSTLPLGGEIVDCDGALPAQLVGHLWRGIEADRARSMGAYIESIIDRLSQLVRADYARSEAGRTAPALRAAIGTPHQDLFDFAAMARLLAGPSGAIGLSESRRRRIAATLSVIKGQRFFGAHAWSFAFGRVDVALAAFNDRLPLMADLVRALNVAELELAGAYAETTHDPVFAGFDETALAREDVARFPSYLVRVRPDDGGVATRALLMDALTSGAPMKVLLEIDDVFGLGGRLATIAVGLGDVFVLQAAGAGLFRQTGTVRAAIEYPGATLLSLFAGSGDAGIVPAYLVGSAATESRAFPTFTYDPAAPDGLAGRLSIDGTPQPERPWPVRPLRYADDELQRVEEALAFTPVDFALCDPARGGCFAEVLRSGWTPDLVPAADQLDPATARADGVPFIWAVDADARLHRLVVDQRVMRAALRMGDAWAQLREMAGPHLVPPTPVVTTLATPVALAAPETIVAEASTPASVPPAPDDPYIETARCTTCNECTTLNGRMFAYNENRQAYVADASAGSYRELVEAAEGCQVAIIHPGKPRDPNEPGLDELVERAQAFL